MGSELTHLEPCLRRVDTDHSMPVDLIILPPLFSLGITRLIRGGSGEALGGVA